MSFYIRVQLVAPVNIYFDEINGSGRVRKLQCRPWCHVRTYTSSHVAASVHLTDLNAIKGIINLKILPPAQ
jgi:hypothetical protein